MRIPSICFAIVTVMLSSGVAVAQTTLDVLYAIPSNFKELHEKIAAEFQKQYPSIPLKFRNAPDTYDDATAQVLRSALVGDQPDVYFNGLNQVRIVASQGHAAALDQFVSSPKEWSELGYIPAMTTLSEVGGKKYGLPFAVSMP